MRETFFKHTEKRKPLFDFGEIIDGLKAQVKELEESLEVYQGGYREYSRNLLENLQRIKGLEQENKELRAKNAELQDEKLRLWAQI